MYQKKRINCAASIQFLTHDCRMYMNKFYWSMFTIKHSVSEMRRENHYQHQRPFRIEYEYYLIIITHDIILHTVKEIPWGQEVDYKSVITVCGGDDASRERLSFTSSPTDRGRGENFPNVMVSDIYLNCDYIRIIYLFIPPSLNSIHPQPYSFLIVTWSGNEWQHSGGFSALHLITSPSLFQLTRLDGSATS